jgi:cytochrome b subunit of formate dehydrogenase
MVCCDCHPGRTFNPHVAPEVDDDVLEVAADFEQFALTSPTAFAACSECHEDVIEEWRESIHGSLEEGASGKHRRPGCSACHGSIHAVVPEQNTKEKLARRCIACHGFAEEGKVPTDPHVVDTYRDTIHGKMVRLGNDRAATCADCHTGHSVFATADPRSTVNMANRPKTCGACHPNATEAFAAAISHEPHHIDRDFWGALTAIGFSVLTAISIFLLFLHVVLDFFRAGRQALLRRRGEVVEEHLPPEGPVRADADLPRFDIHMRIQHFCMLTSFITLVLTGWPLKAASVGASSSIAELFGGQATMAIVHRVAGAVMLGVVFYHLTYLIVRFKRGTLSLAMLPGPKDVADLIGNLMYFLGMKKERPKFGRWTYYEKFDYWAVFWGIFIMGGSGVVLWFPVLASKVMPGEMISLSLIAHSDEALLAALAIFLWHFFNVHLRPAIFPMSWVWLTGKLPAEALYEEHRAEWERLYGKQPPAAPHHPPTWHHATRWSFVAITVVLAAGLAVVLGNVSSVRDQVFGVSHGADHQPQATEVAAVEPAAAGSAVAGQPVHAKVVSAFDEGFDAFTTCFACHNKTRTEEGGAGFPHTMHFEENDVDSTCDSCHVAKWHESMTIETDVCLECHEADEIGLPTH